MKRETVAGRLRAAGCVWAEDEADLLIESASSPGDLEEKIRRRTGGEPLELVVGWAAFRGLRIEVRPGVFIPRKRTEFLAGQAISSMQQESVRCVVELCCGTAAISAAILAEAGAAFELHASDIDPAAVDLARRNLGSTAHLHTGDLFSSLPEDLRGRVDVLVANVPYVPTGDLQFLPAESRLHEPDTTVDGGGDGLRLFRRLVSGATQWLAPNGRLMSEVSVRQAPLAEQIITGQGLRAEVREDENLGATVAIGRYTP